MDPRNEHVGRAPPPPRPSQTGDKANISEVKGKTSEKPEVTAKAGEFHKKALKNSGSESDSDSDAWSPGRPGGVRPNAHSLHYENLGIGEGS